MSVLRDDLLEGRAIALAGGGDGALGERLERLGGRVEAVPELPDDEQRVGEWARRASPLHAIVYDARKAFGTGGETALSGSLERGWVVVREVAAGSLIPADGPGKIVLLGPRPDAGPHATAARDALENLARTLSIEWARYEVTAAMVAPGRATTDEELAELTSFLVSPAGEYFSGCRLELGGVG